MIDYNLKRREEKMIKKLDVINLSDTSDVLDWIQDSLIFPRLFENDIYASEVLRKLEFAMYKEYFSELDESNTLDSLLRGNNELNKRKTAEIIISRTIRYLKRNQRPHESFKTMVELYNQKYNGPKIMSKMVEKLENSIGKEVIVDYIYDGNFLKKKGVIDSITGVKSIVIENDKLLFIGYNTAIYQIQSIDGEVLFSNKLINNKYDLMDFDRIEQLNREIFGNLYDDSLKKVY